MDGLRWLLLVVGLFVVVGVYLYTRYQRGNSEDPAEEEISGARVEPSLGGISTPESEPAIDDDAREEY